MKLNGQPIIKTDDAYMFKLFEPFWGAWKIFGWKNREAGVGINVELVRLALKEKKKIIVNYQDFSYEISAIKIKNFYEKSKIKPIYKVKGDVKLIVVPFSKFKRIKMFDKKAYEEKEKIREEVKSLFNFSY